MKRNLKLNRTKRELIFIFSMLLLPVIWFCVFWIYVNINSIVMAFQEYRGGGNYVFSLANFTDIFHEFTLADSVLREALRNTLLFFPLNLLTIFLSLLFSYLFYKKIPGHRIFRVVYYLPSIISGVIMATAFKNVIGPFGPITYILKNWFGVSGEAIPYWLSDPKYAMGTILLFTFWSSFGLNIIMFGGAMARAPQAVLEAARVEGCGFFREFFSIMIPLIWPTISTVLIFSLAGLFTATGATLLLTNGGAHTMTISLFIFQNVTVSSYEYPAAVGLLFTVIGLPIVLVGRHYLNRFYAEVEY